MKNVLEAISPIDGRYRNKVDSLKNYFSEYALIKYRFKVEVLYFNFLIDNNIGDLKNFPKEKLSLLNQWIDTFSQADAEWVKKKESVIQHDVKSIEYLLKDKLKQSGLDEFSEWVHFGLTSQDINNTAVPMSIADFHKDVFFPEVEKVCAKLSQLSDDWKHISMLAKTHGQPASPTQLGKEIKVFHYRLSEQLSVLKEISISGKFGGATGNFNAHHVAFPEKNWKTLGDEFLTKYLKIDRQTYTTQIENYDTLASVMHTISRMNTILLDASRDLWTYISMDYFKQRINKDEVGSSAMPHKVNPIDFENAEGNLGMANAVFYHLSQKLPVSRLQRDLTDSTVLRNIGVPYAHTMISLNSFLKGLSKIVVNESKINEDLEANWIVVAEAIQTILRREKYPNPYEALKELTRKGEKTGKAEIHAFIDGLEVSLELKAELKQISPFNYTGISLL
ncbi:MAG: adenylosuccinate lyase [Chitinophagaceae bacterium]|nr:MAG: adenylosuccinate lyase [Chitinophagaceae bacterium]